MFNIYNKIGFKYNDLGKSKFNSNISKGSIELPILLSRVGARPIILNDSMEQEAILENAFDIYLDQEVKGIDELTFSIPSNDYNYDYIKNERMVQMFKTVYIMRDINVDKDSMVSDVMCEPLWYDIAYAEPLEKIDWNETNIKSILSDILKNTGWKVGKVDDFRHSSLHLQIDDSRLKALRELEDKVKGELIFDTQNKTVSLVKEVVNHTGASIMYDKNSDNIKANYDTKELITKIYPYGKEKMSIKDANNGIEYVENYGYTKKVRVQRISDERYTNPYELKEVITKALEELSRPRASYVATMKDMSDKSGLEHEKFFIGGLVRIYDKELKLNVDTRIMKWKLNVSEPENSDLNLEYKARSLSELLTGVDNYSNQFGVDSKNGYNNLSVFNQILNSRADDGFMYWSNSGFSIDSSNGGSGNASFKAIGEIAKDKRMSQTIYPSNSNNYAISFKSMTKDLVLNTNSKLGVEIKITYDDGTSEVKFISLAGGI